MNLRDYLQIANHHKLLILVVTLVVGAASFFLSIRETPRYQASAQVLLSYEDLPSMLTNAPNPNTAVSPDRGAATQGRLARVPEVARRALAVARVDDRTPTEFLDGSSVAADPATDFLSFTVADRHPRTAELLATAYATAYVQYRYEIDAAPFRTANGHLTQRLGELRAAGRGRSRLYRDLRSRQEQVDALLALQTPDARVVRRAAAAQQVQPRPARALEVGLPIGLLLGLVMALLTHILNTRARNMAEVELALGLPSLGWIPGSPRRYRHKVAIFEDRNGPYAGAIASVRTNLGLARRAHGSDTLLITTIAGRTPGVKSNAVANLSVAFARAGLHVALVDLDLREPALATLFGLEPQWGVTEVLLGLVELQDALQPVSLEPSQSKRTETATGLGSVEFGGSLRVLPVATLAANPADVIAATRIGVILEQLRAEADLVLIDAPPLLEGSDAAALSTHVDGIAVIAHVGRDRRSVLADARRRLEAIPATALGCIGTGKCGGETVGGNVRLDVPGRITQEVLR